MGRRSKDGINADAFEQVVLTEMSAYEQDGVHAVGITTTTDKGRKILHLMTADEMARYEAMLRAAKRTAFAKPDLN